jgi:hypothetical protein
MSHPPRGGAASNAPAPTAGPTPALQGSWRPPMAPEGPSGPRPGAPPRPVAPTAWAPPPTWAPAPGWAPGSSQPRWGQPGQGQPGQALPPGSIPGWASAARWTPGSGRSTWGGTWLSAPGARPRASRLLPTFLVASIMAAVVLGGIGLDAAIAAPSAGTVTVGGSVVLTAAPGWVLAESNDASSGVVELRRANAALTAQVVSSGYVGSSASLLAVERESLDAEVVQISYGDARTTSINGYDTSYVVFGATVASGGHSGPVDGELICMIVEGNAVVIVVAARQGDLDRIVDDVSAMLESVRVAP